MVKLSRKLAVQYFENYALPRRTRNLDAERRWLENHDKRKICYRRVLPGEEDRGELYPVLFAGLPTFAQFGIGVGLYYFQLIILFAICFCCAFILLPSVAVYRTSDRGVEAQNALLSISGACPFSNVTATVGCDDNASSCVIRSRSNCDISFISILADLVMSLFFCVAIFLARNAENKIIEDLDEAVQTASDYSVCVLDPTPNADNPDEWYDYFSRFGKVRYITVFRSNEPVIRALQRLHIIDTKITEYQQKHEDKVADRFQYLLRLKERFARALQEVCRRTFPVCRVYCTFELEEHQRLCLKELEVPDINAILDIKDRSQTRKLFRNDNVLNVKEPCEPDNILWANLGITTSRRMWSNALSIVISIGLLAAVWYITLAVRVSAPNVIGFVIGVIDSLLPSIFETLTNMSYPKDEGRRQGLLQLRLFAARLLITTLLPYFQSPWDEALSVSFITQVINVQLFACFLSPVVSFMDLGGIIRRNVTAFVKAETQSELHEFWRGSSWSLADKYTAIAKIVFVSLYYALLTPFALTFAAIAFALTFFVDRFLLLRRYQAMPWLNEKIAVQMRQEILLAIAAHMYITTRYIYSWPMDQAYLYSETDSTTQQSVSVVEKVDKFPAYQIWRLSHDMPWQSEAQRRGLLIYQLGTLVVVAITVYTWILLPLFGWLRNLCCRNLKVVGEAQQGAAFSSLDRAVIYEPTVSHLGKQYRCSHVVDVPENVRPFVEKESAEQQRRRYQQQQQQMKPSMNTNASLSLSLETPQSILLDAGDLAHYVPAIHRADVLTVVKYYGDERQAEEGGFKGHDDAAAMRQQQQQVARTADTGDNEELQMLRSPPETPVDSSYNGYSNVHGSSVRGGAPNRQRDFQYVTKADGTLVKVPINFAPRSLSSPSSSSSSGPSLQTGGAETVVVGTDALLERFRPRPVSHYSPAQSMAVGSSRVASSSVRRSQRAVGVMMEPIADRNDEFTAVQGAVPVSRRYLTRTNTHHSSQSNGIGNGTGSGRGIQLPPLPRTPTVAASSVRLSGGSGVRPQTSDSPPRENYLRRY